MTGSVRRRQGLAVATAATGLSLATNGCSFLFVRTPTPKSATEPGACERRSLAPVADGALSTLAALGILASGRPVLGADYSADVRLRHEPWLVRNGNLILSGVVVFGLSSTSYGIVKTSECNALRASASAPAPSPASTPDGGAADVSAPPPPQPPARPAVRQRADDE
jgi:hypothetical protein